MNIQSTQPRAARLQFEASFSRALETAVPVYTGLVAGVGAGYGGLFAGAALGAIVGGVGGAVVGSLAGGAVGSYVGFRQGMKFGAWAMTESGRIGAAHNPENPTQGKAVGQALAGGAITLLTGTPLMTAAVVGGSAAYAAHKVAQG